MVAPWPLWHKNKFILSVRGVTLASALSASVINLTRDLSGSRGSSMPGCTAAESHLATNQTRRSRTTGDGDILCRNVIGFDLRAGTRIHKKLSALANFFETTSFTSD
jgi:hypothetical protein